MPRIIPLGKKGSGAGRASEAIVADVSVHMVKEVRLAGEGKGLSLLVPAPVQASLRLFGLDCLLPPFFFQCLVLLFSSFLFFFFFF